MELNQLLPVTIRAFVPVASAFAVFWNQPAPTPQPVSPAPSPAAGESLSEGDNPSSRRHKITCNVTSISDVKVAEKDRVEAGQTLCDRTEARAALEAKKQQIELALQQPPQLPISTVMTLQLPPAAFSVEESFVAAARAELARVEALPPVQFVHTDIDAGYFQQTTEPQRWQQQLDRQQQIANARYQLGEAIAALNAAKVQRQNDEFLFLQQQQQQAQQLLLEQQQQQQQSTYQKAQLLNDLQELEEKIEQVTAIKSPYAGSIRRVKVTGQSDRTIGVEISLIADSNN